MSPEDTLFGRVLFPERRRASVIDDFVKLGIRLCTFRLEVVHPPFVLDLIDDFGKPEKPLGLREVMGIIPRWGFPSVARVPSVHSAISCIQNSVCPSAAYFLIRSKV